MGQRIPAQSHRESTKAKCSESRGWDLACWAGKLPCCTCVLTRKDTELTRDTADALVSLFPKQKQPIGAQIPATQTNRGDAATECRKVERRPNRSRGCRRLSALRLSALSDHAQVLREEIR